MCCCGGADDDEPEQASEDREFGLLLFQLMNEEWRGLLINDETGSRADDGAVVVAVAVGKGTDKLGNRETGARKAEHDDRLVRMPLLWWGCVFIGAVENTIRLFMSQEQTQHSQRGRGAQIGRQGDANSWLRPTEFRCERNSRRICRIYVDRQR